MRIFAVDFNSEIERSVYACSVYGNLGNSIAIQNLCNGLTHVLAWAYCIFLSQGYS